MKKIDIIIISLLVFTWFSSDSYHLFPRESWIAPFLFSEKSVTVRRLIYDVSLMLNFVIFAICILIGKNLHWLTKDVIWITIGLTLFSIAWYLLMYGNPYYKAELWSKFIVVITIYVSVKSILWHARRNNKFHNR